MFKLVKGKDATTSFLPIDDRTGGKVRYIQNKDTICLTENQARYGYKKIEQGSSINTETMKQEIEQEKLTETDRENDNPCKKVILSKVYWDEDKMMQIQNWSLLSDNVRYVQHDGKSKTPHKLDINTLDYHQYKALYCKLKGEKSHTLDVDFGIHPETMKSNYLHMYEGVHADMVYTNRFDENSDLTMTYLGQTKMTRETGIKAEEKIPITGQGFTLGKLLDGTECQILLDMGACKLYMSKSYYLRCKSLHALPKFASNTQRIQVGNGQYVGVVFVIPVIVDVHGHRFEIFNLVSEIHEKVDLVLRIKNIFELDGVTDSHDSCFSFLNRSIPFFPKEKTEINPKEQKLVIVEAPFVEEISGMAIVKLLDMQEQVTNMINLKFIRNRVTLKVTNNNHETVMFDLTEMIGILDLRSLDYFHIKQDVLQQNLSKHYHFESADVMCKQFNRFVNLLKKKKKILKRIIHG